MSVTVALNGFVLGGGIGISGAADIGVADGRPVVFCDHVVEGLVVDAPAPEAQFNRITRAASTDGKGQPQGTKSSFMVTPTG